jgi:hypothetical protein
MSIGPETIENGHLLRREGHVVAVYAPDGSLLTRSPTWREAFDLVSTAAGANLAERLKKVQKDG